MQGKASLSLAFLSLWRHRMLVPKALLRRSVPSLTVKQQAEAKRREDAIVVHLATSAEVTAIRPGSESLAGTNEPDRCPNSRVSNNPSLAKRVSVQPICSS